MIFSNILSLFYEVIDFWFHWILKTIKSKQTHFNKKKIRSKPNTTKFVPTESRFIDENNGISYESDFVTFKQHFYLSKLEK